MPSQVLTSHHGLPLTRPSAAHFRPSASLRDWASLQQRLKSRGRVSCLFSDNRREEQARKALQGALGGKKSEFDKWDKEIKMREEAGGGGDAGGGGWFGWGRRFGWSDGEHFWAEAQQVALTILGIICMYLIIAKGEVLLAVIFNPLLFALRGTRNSVSLIASQILRRLTPSTHAPLDAPTQRKSYNRVSAKEEVLRKWG